MNVTAFAMTFSARIIPLVRTWGWRLALVSCLAFLGAGVFYLAEFLAAPASLHLYGVYYGLRDKAELFTEYATASALVGAWMRAFGRRLVAITGMALAVLVLNLAFAWTSHVIGWVLVLLPTWIPQGLFTSYLSYVQFPFVRSALDLYYTGWLGVFLLLSMTLFKSGLAKRLVHSLELSMLVLVPLPLEVFLFDRREFDIQVVDAQLGTPLQWFTNADLLLVLAIGLSALAIADGLFLRDEAPSGLAGRLPAS